MKSLENVAADINNYVDYIVILQLIGLETNVPYNYSPLEHFKEALWLYSELYERYGEEPETPENTHYVASIEYHLRMGILDVLLDIIETIKSRIRQFLQLPGNFVKKAEIRNLHHEYKALEISIRMGPRLYNIEHIEDQIGNLKMLYSKSQELCNRIGGARFIIKGS